MAWFHGDIVNEPIDRDSIRWRIVRSELVHRVLHPESLQPRDSHGDRRTSKGVSVLHRKGTDPGPSTSCDPQRNVWGWKRTRIQDQYLFDTLRLVRTAAPRPIAPPQSCTTKVMRFKSRPSISCIKFFVWVAKTVVIRLRFIAQPTANMVDGDDAVNVPKSRNDRSVVKGPRRISMNRQYRTRSIARAFVDIMLPNA